MDARNLRDKLVGSEDERAVSPVIGVILMVAITVILAAVIAAFVMDIGPGGEAVQGQISVSGESSEVVEITVTEGGDADGLVIAQEGEILFNSVEVGTGTTIEVGDEHSDATHNELDIGDADTEDDFDVYLINGELTDQQHIDDADGSLHVGSITVSGSDA